MCSVSELLFQPQFVSRQAPLLALPKVSGEQESQIQWGMGGWALPSPPAASTKLRLGPPEKIWVLLLPTLPPKLIVFHSLH